MYRTSKCGNKRRRLEDTSDDDVDNSSMSSITSRYNHIYFNNDITYDSAHELNQKLFDVQDTIKKTSMKMQLKEVPIYLHITTYGGYIHAAFSVIDCIEKLDVPVYTVVDGFVASAGTLISLAGEKRYITKNAYMLIHELRSGMWGKMTSIDEEYSNLKKLMDHIIDFYMERTLFKRKQLEKILKKDIIWNATECIEKGLIHDVY